MTYSDVNNRVKSYNGEWVMNVRQGWGEMIMRDGTVYKGNFVENHA